MESALNMAEIGERLATIETTQRMMQETLARIEGYHERSAIERGTQYTETVTRLSVIENNQATVKSDLKDYQIACSAERAVLAADVQALKQSRAWHGGKVAGISACVSFLVSSMSIVYNIITRK